MVVLNNFVLQGHLTYLFANSILLVGEICKVISQHINSSSVFMRIIVCTWHLCSLTYLVLERKFFSLESFYENCFSKMYLC